MATGCILGGFSSGWNGGSNGEGVLTVRGQWSEGGGKEQGDAMAEPARVYELRIYHVMPGKLESLMARFRDYTDKLFAKHGMRSVAYWMALDEPVKSSTFFTFWSIRAAKQRPRTGKPSRPIRNGRP